MFLPAWQLLFCSQQLRSTAHSTGQHTIRHARAIQQQLHHPVPSPHGVHNPFLGACGISTARLSAVVRRRAAQWYDTLGWVPMLFYLPHFHLLHVCFGVKSCQSRGTAFERRTPLLPAFPPWGDFDACTRTYCDEPHCCGKQKAFAELLHATGRKTG